MLYTIILVLGIANGLILAKLCKEEIGKWRKKLWIMNGVCLILGILVFILNFEYKIPVAVGLGFIVVNDLTVIFRSY